MNDHHTFRRRRRYAALCLISAIAVGVVLAWLLHAGRLASSAVDSFGHGGAGLFFAAMAVLPVFGFPLAVFNLAAGPVVAPSLGLWPTVAWATVAIGVNVAVSYALARYVVRPPVVRLLGWLGYAIPELPRSNAWSFSFLVRIVPGPPFVFQSYLLGAAETPFIPYLVASCIVDGGYAALSIVGVNALQNRDTRAGLLVLALFGVLAIGLRLYRNRRRPAQPAAGGDEPVPAAGCGENLPGER